MSTTNPGDEHDGNVDNEEKGGLTDSLTKDVDQWKARIDELRVQINLAKLDVSRTGDETPRCRTKRAWPPCRSCGMHAMTQRSTPKRFVAVSKSSSTT